MFVSKSGRMQREQDGRGAVTAGAAAGVCCAGYSIEFTMKTRGHTPPPHTVAYTARNERKYRLLRCPFFHKRSK